MVFDMIELERLHKAAQAIKERTVGFPQGANFSPFLSILSLGSLKPYFADILMYADDGLIFSDSEFSEKQVSLFFEKMGLVIAPSKSK